MKEKYKVGWYDEAGKRHYQIADREEVLSIVADKLDTSGHISIKKTAVFKIAEG